MAEGDVGGRVVGIGSLPVGSGIGAGPGLLIAAVADDVSRVVVEAVQGNVEGLGDVESQASPDGVALIVEGVEGTTPLARTVALGQLV